MHNQTIESVLSYLETSHTRGLTNEEVEKRLREYGPNALPEHKKTPLFLKFLAQFKDVLVLVLIAATIVSFFLGEKLDAAVIGSIVLLNAALGFIQEEKAEKAIEALKKLSMDYAKVVRNGEIKQIPVSYLVPGDIIHIETGDKIPADAKLLEAVSLDISEAVLTGESSPVRKDPDAVLHEKTLLAERKNMVFKDTTILFGRGKAVVISTGLHTEIGKISQMLATEQKDESPLAEQLDRVAKKLSLAAGIIIVFLFAINVTLRETEPSAAFFTAVSLAVAAIPEGLPAVVTMVLAAGTSKLAKSNAIVRRLKAVETLGATNYILTDKTGTLTINQMTVTDIVTQNMKCVISDNLACIDDSGNQINPKESNELMTLFTLAALCNDAEICDDGECPYLGDPTETALLEAVKNAGLDIKEIRKRYKRVYEIPFSSKFKKMLVVVEDLYYEDKMIVMAKGAAEVLEWMVTEKNEVVEALNENLAKVGLRNLAFSFKEITKKEFEEAKEAENPEDVLSTYHEFAGIMSQKDPVRPEVKEALQKATRAGIKTVVLTGDNKLTALNIALELGLIKSEDEVMDGSELGDMEGKKLLETLEKIKVFARVTPEQKLRITNTIKDQGNIVAVTGDGVNDAPAIKAADIGISMGITGTDVSKEVADMVLQDDNYATIVEAIRHGRVVYDNLIKFIRYLISCNLSEIIVIGSSIIVGLPLPLLPVHILWVNLATDGFPALALGMEPGEKDIMKRRPRDHHSHLLSKKRWIRMGVESAIISLATFIMFAIGRNYSLDVARTLTFTTLVFAQLFHSLNNRSEEHSIFSRDLKKNTFLYVVILVSMVLQLIILYTPVGQTLLRVTGVEPKLLGMSFGMALLPVIGAEMIKFFGRRGRKEFVHRIV